MSNGRRNAISLRMGPRPAETGGWLRNGVGWSSCSAREAWAKTGILVKVGLGRKRNADKHHCCAYIVLTEFGTAPIDAVPDSPVYSCFPVSALRADPPGLRPKPDRAEPKSRWLYLHVSMCGKPPGVPSPPRCNQLISSSLGGSPGRVAGARWMHGGTGQPGYSKAIRQRCPRPNEKGRAAGPGR